MYKIITDLKQLEEINQAASNREGKAEVKYCDIVKHPIKELYIIPIIKHLLLNYKLDFITEEWLNTDIVESYPEDWEWIYPERRIRIQIPLKLQALSQISNAKKPKDPKATALSASSVSAIKEYPVKDMELLGQLLNAMLPLIPGYMVINESDYIIVYLEELYAEHRYVLELFDDVIIEEK
jgi:hypothetical protein